MFAPDGPTAGSLADDTDDADPEKVARAIVLRRLAAAPRTRAQLAGDLAKRDVPDGVARRVLDRFTEVGLIDDAAFALLWVDSRRRTRGSSRSVLRRELRERGVGSDEIETALADVTDLDERERARSLVEGRLSATARLTREARVRRLTGLLVRRGYHPGLAATIVREALDDVP